MLQKVDDRSPRGDAADTGGSYIDIYHVVDALRRDWRRIALWGLVAGFITGIVSLTLIPVLFTATMTMAFDPRRVQVLVANKLDNSVIGDMPVDNPTVDSQVTALQSSSVLNRVIDRYKLTADPNYNGQAVDPLMWPMRFVSDTIKSITGDDDPPTELELRRNTLNNMLKRLTVKRYGQSYVVDVTVDARSPKVAADIANAIGDAWFQDQIDVVTDMSRKARTWLEQRLTELRKQVADAETEVINFKVANNFVDISGVLLNEQQMRETTTQIALVRTQVADARAKLERTADLLRSGDTMDLAVTDLLRDDMVRRLREQLADANRRVAELALRHGNEHAAVTNARNEARDIQRAIGEELRRLAEAYKTELGIAEQREAALQANLSALVRDYSDSRRLQIKLRQLESSVASYRGLYESLLQRYNIAAQQESLELTDARVLTVALPPKDKSWPKTLLFVAFAMILGVGLRSLVALYRHRQD